MPSDALTSPAAERNKTVTGDIIAKYFPDRQKDEFSYYKALEIIFKLSMSEGSSLRLGKIFQTEHVWGQFPET